MRRSRNCIRASPPSRDCSRRGSGDGGHRHGPSRVRAARAESLSPAPTVAARARGLRRALLCGRSIQRRPRAAGGAVRGADHPRQGHGVIPWRRRGEAAGMTNDFYAWFVNPETPTEADKKAEQIARSRRQTAERQAALVADFKQRHPTATASARVLAELAQLEQLYGRTSHGT